MQKISFILVLTLVLFLAGCTVLKTGRSGTTDATTSEPTETDTETPSPTPECKDDSDCGTNTPCCAGKCCEKCEMCEAGSCSSYKNKCKDGTCDFGCCETDADCDDMNPCNVDKCVGDKGECKHEKRVIIYTTPTCHFCTSAKNLLKLKKIDFEEKDVSTDADAWKEMVEKSGQTGVPVLDIDGTIIVGYDKKAIEAALKKLSPCPSPPPSKSPSPRKS